MSNWNVWKKEKHYQKLFWAGTINGIGNRISQVAVLTLLYQITGAGGGSNWSSFRNKDGPVFTIGTHRWNACRQIPKEKITYYTRSVAHSFCRFTHFRSRARGFMDGVCKCFLFINRRSAVLPN